MSTEPSLLLSFLNIMNMSDFNCFLVSVDIRALSRIKIFCLYLTEPLEKRKGIYHKGTRLPNEDGDRIAYGLQEKIETKIKKSLYTR